MRTHLLLATLTIVAASCRSVEIPTAPPDLAHPVEDGWGTPPDCNPGGSACELLPAEIEAVRWFGYYRDTKRYLDGLQPADFVPRYTLEGPEVRIVWPVVVTEDCSEPTHWVVTRAPSTLRLDLIHTGMEGQHCNDNDEVTSVAARVRISSGHFAVDLVTNLSGFHMSTPSVTPFFIDVP